MAYAEELKGDWCFFNNAQKLKPCVLELSGLPGLSILFGSMISENILNITPGLPVLGLSL